MLKLKRFNRNGFELIVVNTKNALPGVVIFNGWIQFQSVHLKYKVQRCESLL